VKCDICKRQKQETNHWLVAITTPGFEGILFVPADAACKPLPGGYVSKDLCGQECAHKELSAWLDDFKNIDFPTKEGRHDND
jgi:hypothetical protein